MGYFRELPNLLYPSFLKDKNSSLDYLEVKNMFRRVKLRDDLQTSFTMFDKYEIPEGYRPEVVAEKSPLSVSFVLLKSISYNSGTLEVVVASV